MSSSVSSASKLTTALKKISKINISMKQNECLQLIQEAGQGEKQELFQHIVKIKASYA